MLLSVTFGNMREGMSDGTRGTRAVGVVKNSQWSGGDSNVWFLIKRHPLRNNVMLRGRPSAVREEELGTRWCSFVECADKEVCLVAIILSVGMRGARKRSRQRIAGGRPGARAYRCQPQPR